MGQRYNNDEDMSDAHVLVEADMELNRYQSSLLGDMDDGKDVHVEACSNCGAYHTEAHNRCLKCQAI